MLSMIVQTVVAPAVACASLLVLGARVWRRPRRSAGAWLAAALATGYVAGHLAVAGMPPRVPVGATDWLGHVAALAALAAGLRAALPERAWARWIIDGASAVAIAYLVMRVPIATQWSLASSALAVGGAAAVIVVASRALANAAARTSSLTMLAALGVATAASAGIMVLSGTVLVGLLVGGLAAAIGAAFLVELAARGSVDAAPAAPVVAALLTAAWTIALLFAELPTLAAPLWVVAPLGLWLAARIAADRLRPALTAAVCLAALALPLAGAAGLAASSYFGGAGDDAADAGDYDYDYGYD